MTRKWVTLAVVNVAVFMLLLDITVVNTALPSISEDLNASFTDLQWVVDAYTLTLAAFVLVAGSLADRLGRRRVFAWGLGIFTIASGAAALATDPTWLNLSRAVQGVGAAVMFAVSLALIAQEFKGRELGMAMGLYGATIGAAVAIGPLVGGALDGSIGWESVFGLNVPIGIAAIALTYAQSGSRATRRPAASTGRGWRRSAVAVHAGARAPARQRRGLGQHADRRPARRRGRPCSSRSWWWSCVRSSRCCRCTCSGSPPSRASSWRVRDLGVDVRAVPLPDALHAEHPRAVAARERASATCR